MDEYNLSRMLTAKNQQSILEDHWKSFITENDFASMPAMGLNLVRLPIGYWAFSKLPEDPYILGQERYVDAAILWAQKYGLKLQLDIHGMPGSQNGFDNSGHRRNHLHWFKYEDKSYEVLAYVFQKYGLQGSTVKDETTGQMINIANTIHSIQVVNEPFSPKLDMSKLRQFYEKSYQLGVEKGVHVPLVYHDAFLPLDFWNGFMNGKNAILDHHHYEIFSPANIGMNIHQHNANVRLVAQLMKNQPHRRVVGEFSGALTDCTKYLNGVGRGARFDGTYLGNPRIGDCAVPESLADTKQFLYAQFLEFEAGTEGWIFWTWKAEDSLQWDYKRLHEMKII